MDRISSGIVDIICAQTRARAASDKLYETQRVQSGVCSNYIAHHLQRHPHGVTLGHDPLPPLVPGAGAVSKQRRAADDVL